MEFSGTNYRSTSLENQQRQMYTSDEGGTQSPADLRKAKSPHLQPMQVGEGLVGPYTKVNNLIDGDQPGDVIPRSDATDASARFMGLQPISENGSPGKTTVKDSNIG